MSLAASAAASAGNLYEMQKQPAGFGTENGLIAGDGTDAVQVMAGAAHQVRRHHERRIVRQQETVNIGGMTSDSEQDTKSRNEVNLHAGA